MLLKYFFSFLLLASIFMNGISKNIRGMAENFTLEPEMIPLHLSRFNLKKKLTNAKFE